MTASIQVPILSLMCSVDERIKETSDERYEEMSDEEHSRGGVVETGQNPCINWHLSNARNHIQK